MQSLQKAYFLTVLTVCSMTAQAEVLTFPFTAQVTSVSAPDVWDGSIAVGTPITGSFSFDTTVADTNSDSSRGWYPQDITGAIHFTYQAGNYMFTSSPGYMIQVSNDIPQGAGTFDLYVVQTNNSDTFTTASNGISEVVGFAKLSVGALHLFHSTDLPLSPPSLGGEFGSSIHFFHAGGNSVQATLTTLTPEPSAIMLIVTGVLFIAGRRH